VIHLAVPNLSEGRDFEVLDRLQESLGDEVTLLDRHTDIDHNRAVFTLMSKPADLVPALTRLSAEAVRDIDITRWQGMHPCIGSLDVCPVVWTRGEDVEAAKERAIETAGAIGETGVPVFLYGSLASSPEREERSFFREGGIDRLWQRMGDGSLEPDFGPALPHATAGATLVTARPPLAAFNVELDTDDIEVAKAVAAKLRESGGGLPGVRAIGLLLSTGRAQVSTNVHDPIGLPLAEVVARIRDLAKPLGARPIEAELIGLLPEAALAGYPEDVPIRDFDPDFHVIEKRCS